MGALALRGLAPKIVNLELRGSSRWLEISDPRVREGGAPILSFFGWSALVSYELEIISTYAQIL